MTGLVSKPAAAVRLARGIDRGIIRFIRPALFVLLFSAPSAAMPENLKAPALHLPTLQDEKLVSLENFLGKVIYVDFWASWCGPCRKAMPLYEVMYQEIGSENFEILAVNLDEDRQDALKFLQQHAVSYPVLTDPSGVTAAAWGLKVMPSSFLLDPSGHVVRTYPGFKTSHMGEIRNDIDTLLEQR